MGEAKNRRQSVLRDGAMCIFCGGREPATTIEHCPPRALFKQKHWPEGFEFPSCERCNGGSSDDDLLVAFLAHLDPHEPAAMEKGIGLFRLANRQKPGLADRMMSMSISERRAMARKLGVKRGPGETYSDLGFMRVPEEMHRAVEVFAGKLTRGIYQLHVGSIFPAHGQILFHWFTNVAAYANDGAPALKVLKSFGLATAALPLRRSGKDLNEQFDYAYSTTDEKDLHLIQAVFGSTFGFVTFASLIPGVLEEKVKQGREEHGPDAKLNGWKML